MAQLGRNFLQFVVPNTQDGQTGTASNFWKSNINFYQNHISGIHDWWSTRLVTHTHQVVSYPMTFQHFIMCHMMNEVGEQVDAITVFLKEFPQYWWNEWGRGTSCPSSLCCSIPTDLNHLFHNVTDIVLCTNIKILNRERFCSCPSHFTHFFFCTWWNGDRKGFHW